MFLKSKHSAWRLSTRTGSLRADHAGASYHGNVGQMDSTQTSPKRLKTVQALRGLAAIGVLFWHCSFFISPYGTGLGSTLFYSAATMCVDLFFLICGFVITITSFDGKNVNVTPRSFFIKRLSRILPLYLFYTFTIFIAELTSERQTVELLIRSITFYPVVNDTMPNLFSPTLNVGWSITYEVYFYASVFFSLFFGRSFFTFLLFIATTVIIIPAIVTGAPVFDPYYNKIPGSAPLGIVSNPLNLLFLIGMAIGLIYQSSFKFPDRRWALVFATLGVTIFVIHYAFQINIRHGILGAGVASSILLFTLVIAEKSVQFDPPKPVVFLGNISYSLYLSHPTAIWIYIYVKNYFGIINPFGGWLALTSVTLMSIGFSSITYQVIELRFGHWLTKRMSSFGIGTVGDALRNLR